MSWNLAVNITTMAWLVMFCVGFMIFDADLIGMNPLVNLPDNFKPYWTVANWSIWIVFAIDVFFKWKKSKDYKTFLRNHWLDLILLIPFFRVLTMLRLLRLLRLVRLAKMSKAGFKIWKKLKRL